MTEIDAVTFDIGGTLSKGGLNRKQYQSMVANYLGRLGFEIGFDEYQKATNHALGKLRQRRKNQREMRFEDFCTIVLQEIGIDPTEEMIEEIRNIYYHCFRQEKRKGAANSISELSKNYKLGAISNSMSSLPLRFLKRANLEKFFDAVIISCREGHRKPHRAIFQKALDELEVEANEAIHVGNLLNEDVKGPKNVGMYSVLTNPAELEEGEIAPDLVVNSVRDVPEAIQKFVSFNFGELEEFLEKRCRFCSSDCVSIFKVDFEIKDLGDFIPLCMNCYKDFVKPEHRKSEFTIKRRRRRKARAIYRRTWSKSHMP